MNIDSDIDENIRTKSLISLYLKNIYHTVHKSRITATEIKGSEHAIQTIRKHVSPSYPSPWYHHRSGRSSVIWRLAMQLELMMRAWASEILLSDWNTVKAQFLEQLTNLTLRHSQHVRNAPLPLEKLPSMTTDSLHVGSPVAIWTRSGFEPLNPKIFTLHQCLKPATSIISNTSISSSSPFSSELLSTSWTAFTWFLRPPDLRFVFFKFARTSHFSNSSRTSDVLTAVLPFKTFLFPCFRSFLSQTILSISLNRRLRMIFSAQTCWLRASTFGISRRIEVLSSFQMANSDSFELRESSSALFWRRSSKVGVDGMAKPEIGCGLLNKSPEDGTSRCLFRFGGTNPEWRHPAQLFLNAFGLALM